MSSYKKYRGSKNQGSLVQLVMLLSSLIAALIYLIYRLIAVIYDMITVYSSGYKAKSGNGFFKTYFDKGNYGEFLLYRKLTGIFRKDYVLTNLYLEGKRTDTTEIDVLVVSMKGVYVFEMKNYAGYIFGDSSQENWTQTLNRFVKNKFYNPFRQNYGHTMAVEKFLKIDNTAIIPAVVFTNRSKLKKVTLNSNENLFQLKQLKKFIKSQSKNRGDVFSLAQVDALTTQLITVSNASEETKKKHIESIKRLVESKNVS